MIFDEAVDLNLNKSLKKIRIKVDPLYSSYSNFRNINSYEGYVVTETLEALKIMVIKPGLPIVMLPKLCMLSDKKLDMFKAYLIKAQELGEETPLYNQIQNSTHLEDIEIFLKQAGRQDTDIVELYRNYIYRHEQDKNI
jgi:hypothetical protein